MLTDTDLEQIQADGRDPLLVRRALSLLSRPIRRTRLIRPATLGDGILALTEDEAMAAESRAGAATIQARVSSFIPASGASTRLAASLDAAALERYPHIAKALSELDASRLPKGLLPVHDYGDHARTPLEEHMREAYALTRDERGYTALHLTVGTAELSRFREAADAIAHRLGWRIHVYLSTQDRATDMPFVDASGDPVRDVDGRLRFRPGGHGALLGNLASLDADIVLVKNIDNVVVDRARPPVLRARRRLLGTLLMLQDALRDARAAGEAAVRAWFARHTGESVEDVDAALSRPMRVCGMVPNSGAPGGGPFWTESGLQIVEGVEIDREDAEQSAILAASTHFNPVELALATRDLDGQPLDLLGFTDPGRVLRARKQVDGEPVDVIEHPGLWNGGMARWITVFVHMPAEVFAPIKTVADLETPPHRA